MKFACIATFSKSWDDLVAWQLDEVQLCWAVNILENIGSGCSYCSFLCVSILRRPQSSQPSEVNMTDPVLGTFFFMLQFLESFFCPFFIFLPHFLAGDFHSSVSIWRMGVWKASVLK